MSAKTVNQNPDVLSLIKQVYESLEKKDWDSADQYSDKIIEIDSKVPEAYLGKLLVELECTKPENLQFCDASDILLSPFRRKLYDCVNSYDDEDEDEDETDVENLGCLVARQINLSILRQNLNDYFDYETVKGKDGDAFIIKKCKEEFCDSIP